MMEPVAGRRTNLALLVLVPLAAASGALMYGIGSGWNRWATVAHGAAGVAVVALSPWKAAVSRSGVRRRGAAEASPSIALAAAVVATLATGVAHRAGATGIGPVSVLQVHVAAALAAVALTVWHAGARPVRPRPADLSRRAVLRGGLLAGGSTLVTVALPSAGRQPTRSLERGSFDPAAMPVTSWLDDRVPDAGDGWRLVVAGRPWSLADLDGLGTDELVATLDCTGGWYADQAWAGVRLDRLLEASGAGPGGAVEVRSLTGYARRFPRADAARLLVATRAGGEPLSPGHGWPARLVAPGRRGFWWVKWVDEVRVDDRPWWWQPPVPLT
jgi:Oxidoreductase molybdopterin binding domain